MDSRIEWGASQCLCHAGPGEGVRLGVAARSPQRAANKKLIEFLRR